MTLPFDPFAEANQLLRTQCRNGISYNDLGLSAHRVFVRSSGANFLQLQDGDIPPWEAVAGKAASIIDLPESEQADLNISAKALAKALYNQYNVECDRYPDWESTESKEKIAWEAVGRHMANLIDSDGSALDFEDMENRVTEWAHDRIYPAQTALS